MSTKLFGLLLAAGLALGYTLGCSPDHLPDLKLPSTFARNSVLGTETPDPCSGKARCIVAYFAPWCGVCHASIPLVKKLREKVDRSPEVGLKIIIGDADNSQVVEMAAQVGGLTLADPDGEFNRAMRVSAMPTWWVVDSNRKVLERFSGGITSADDRALKWFIDNKLDLEDYLR